MRMEGSIEEVQHFLKEAKDYATDIFAPDVARYDYKYADV